MNTYANHKPNYYCFLKLLEIFFFIEVFGKLWETFLHSLLPFCFTRHRQSKRLSLRHSLSGGQWTGSGLDGGDDRWLGWAGRTPGWVYMSSSAAGNPVQPPTLASPPALYLEDGFWERSAVWQGEVRGLASELWPTTDGTLHSASGKDPEVSAGIPPGSQLTWPTGLVVWEKAAFTRFRLDLSHACFLSLPDYAFIHPLFPSPLLHLCGKALPSFLWLCRTHSSTIYPLMSQGWVSSPLLLLSLSLSLSLPHTHTHTHSPYVLSDCSVSQKIKMIKSAFSLPSAWNQ